MRKFIALTFAFLFATPAFAAQFERPEVRADGDYSGETIRIQGAGDAMTPAEKAKYRVSAKTEFRFYERAKPPRPALTDLELVDLPCYGPVPLPTPPLQDAFSGVWESLTYPGDLLDYIVGDQLTIVNLRLGAGLANSTFLLYPGQTNRIVKLTAPGTSTQIGLIKICSPTFNYCRELLIRAVVNGEVVVPDPGFHFQRFGALNPVAGSTCEF